ncbi:hypothetical protein L195_g005802 [Trifolium pratense]|uniref:Zinc knuckle CX2CX4HX4C domain-containing protein n=1 Tax=Trifolium pratense TaxID=57577 RepID=A0A2K3P1T3_TRIPR|nr:hypothetical protein L195_g005802 [Trifolium pratense]
MADLWKPVRGVTIKEARRGLFLFSFSHPLDMEEVLNGGPWTFDNNMLIMDRESMGTKLANYIETFVEYDKNKNTSFWRQFMRVRVKIDVRQPLKKDTRVKDRAGEWCNVNFKYEKLGVFCFVCGIMGHTVNKCEVRYSMENNEQIRGDKVEDKRHGG